MYKHSNSLSKVVRAALCLKILAMAGWLLTACTERAPRVDPWEHLPTPVPHTDHATLIQGPCLDFGVISDPARVDVALQVLTLGPDAISLVLAPTTLLFAPRGLVAVDPIGVHIDPMETLLLDGGDAARVGLRATEPGIPLLVVSLSPRTP